jgi:aspartyl/asparaginyl beta-hydroxylase (cupin superfamily)
MDSIIPIENEYYYVVNERYKGKMPVYFSEEQFPESTLIKNNYEVIKNEVENYFNNNKIKDLNPGFIPHSWDGKGWKSIGLYAFGFKRNKNCKKFPVLTKLIESIPTMTSAQISVMQPGTRLMPHIDDTSAVVRIHLGIKIPGTLPELGFRMSGQEVCWKEGELLILSPVRPHYAWNNTKESRIVVIVDVIHKQYKNRKLHICGNVIAQLGMKYIASKFIILKKIPRDVTFAIHKTLGYCSYLFLLLRTSFKI